tara:strand:+ start:634 stop:1284 length:651 start_codon:yes stop_codon:yes gene_type:complete
MGNTTSRDGGNVGKNAGDSEESSSNQSEVSLLTAWDERVEKPLTLAVTPWESAVVDSAQGSATSSEMFEGRLPSDIKAWVSADLFTGGLGDLLASTADALNAEPALVGFEPINIAQESILIGEGELAGVGIQVRARFDRVSTSMLTDTQLVEQVWRTIGWIKPDRIPDNKDALIFIRDLGASAREIGAVRRAQQVMPEVVIDDESRAEFRKRVANA